MPAGAKRKRNGAPAAPASGNTSVRRRSTRNKSDVFEDLEGPAALGVLYAKGEGERRPRAKATNSHESKADVRRAMRNLQDMEDSLQSDLRRQRKAVQTSELSVELDEATATDTTVPIKPSQPPRPGDKQTVNDGDQGGSDSVEQAPLDNYDAESAEADLTAQPAEDGAERGARRPPPVNSDMLPLPWTGRLGYACLNTYLRASNPPVFSSRTCRISSIIEHRHPLQNPDEPEHATKNRPDKGKPADVARGTRYVQALGLANARDITKMLRWNDKYGIKFLRLSSEMFPFASHAEHGYKLSSFAVDTLADAGKVAAELGHRLTTHPGQFTQLGSPRKEVITAAMRDLEYHAEMLSLLKLPEQQDLDAVMILHMGGTYGDKAAALDRFRENYAKLSKNVKQRLVLENDDVSWTVHDLLPVCEELNIPMVLDYHHHNILFDPKHIREGTHDIISLYDRIKATWTRKNIRQKMHYSEQTPKAITPRERRKHSPRVRTLPPCANDMDLMIEAKDKEQAVFELMRTFKLPGWDTFNDVVPYERDDESKKAIMKKKPKKSAKPKKKKVKTEDGEANGQSKGDVEETPDDDGIEVPEKIVSAEDFGMGGPENRVYWPVGMEEWLRPMKREIKKGKKEEDKVKAEEKDD